MRFDYYLMEHQEYQTEGRNTAISKDKAMKLISTKCSKILGYYKEGGQYIYRAGSRVSGEFALSQPAKFSRKSANTSNYYTLLMDNLPSWSRYPRRSKSIVCSNDKYTAANYSYGRSQYIVFPYDTCKIGICPDSDIWDSIPRIPGIRGIEEWESINSELEDIGGLSDNNWSDFKARVDSLDKNQEMASTNRVIRGWALSKFDTITDYLNDAMSPKKCGFRVVKPGDKIPAEGKNELWVGEADSVLVVSEYIETYLDAL